ncbi:hypothetical protein [Nocardia terpenica]|uniref:MinD-like ATPase involved in chromosome partitioning or flagellar assembly n=1 Tax=Nocardia terpenica TaxID=455432 RepID=A0A291RSX0_9NOCA|nr:hypothetical protein [Nocardia terpenica]ATL70646.1 hypothetical protein CRH09_35205 [Nocardia terpenica]
MFVALTSASGSPGTSTTALGLALCAPADDVFYVEADPCGGSFLHTGYYRSERPRRTSVVGLIEAHQAGRLADGIREQAEPIPETRVQALTGMWTTRQAMVTRTIWGPLGRFLAESTTCGVTVVADTGRYGHRYGATDLLTAADVVGVVCRAGLAELGVLHGVLPDLRRDLTAAGSTAVLGVILVGSHYSPSEVRRALGVDVLTTLPYAPDHAAVFSHGARLRRFRQTRSRYLAELRRTWPRLADVSVARPGDGRSGR